MCLRFCFVLGKGLQVTKKSPPKELEIDIDWSFIGPWVTKVVRFFQAVEKKPIERPKWCAFVTKKDRGLPCSIMKQEKAACHFCPHAALTPRRNAARRRFTDVSFWGFCGDFRKKCHQSSVFQRLCDGVPSDKVFHKTAVQRWKEKMTGAPSLSCGP